MRIHKNHFTVVALLVAASCVALVGGCGTQSGDETARPPDKRPEVAPPQAQPK